MIDKPGQISDDSGQGGVLRVTFPKARLQTYPISHGGLDRLILQCQSYIDFGGTDSNVPALLLLAGLVKQLLPPDKSDDV